MKYLIDSEVKEEIYEILELENIYKDYSTIIICCPVGLLNDSDEATKYKLVQYQLGKFRFINKLKQLAFLIYSIVKYRPDIVFSGYPMLKHRLVNIFSAFRIKHYSYLRGLFADSKNYKGFSDHLYLMLKKYHLPLTINNFQCDKIFTISALNIKFLLARSAKQENIELIPPPWLEKIKKQKTLSGSDVISGGHVYFVTQAFMSHSCKAAAESQIVFATELHEHLKQNGVELIIRKHPRDYTDYEKYGFSINNISSYEFIRTLCPNDILITPFSTMAFEARFFDVNIIFYSTSDLDELYKKVYSDLNITPFYNVAEIGSEIRDFYGKSKPLKNVENIFYINSE